MRAGSAARAAAAALAVVALADPRWSVTRRAPLAVEVRAADREYDALAADIRTRLANVEGVQVEPGGEPRAIVLVGDTVSADALTVSLPVSVVLRPNTPNVRVGKLTTDADVLPGWTTSVHATVEAIGMAGKTSTIVLGYQGVHLQALEHRWATDREIFNAVFAYVPAAAGTSTLRVTARPLDSEATSDDNHADVQVAIDDRKLRVLFFEPRPSWAIAFARRAIEHMPFFEVQTLARPSRGVEARTSNAPANLFARLLEPFDAVVIGAPEELRAADLDALGQFSGSRGGAVVFMPDRRPSGPYAAWLPARSFDEVLTQQPATLHGVSPALECSESAVLTEPAAGVDVIATLPRESARMPVVVSWPHGAGRVMFSGCLDAWRYRGGDDSFARFWTAHIARAAAEAPGRIDVSASPAAVLPGQAVRITARVRRTEFLPGPSRLEIPPISARVTDPAGALSPLRLWPAPEPGVFEGSFTVSGPGRYLVEALLPGAPVVAKGVTVMEGVRSAEHDAAESLRALAAATGGVVVTADNLAPLEQQLEGIAGAATTATIYPSRSPWWALAFIGLISVDWFVRRRAGRV